METTEKKSFYKSKAFIVPLVAVLALAIVSAATYAYFHTVQADLTVTEARSSAEIDFVLNCYSGDTMVKELTIHNAAQVQLCANVEYTETNNSGVVYTTNLPMDVTLAPNADTTIQATFTCDEMTDAGSASGIIGFSKIACAA